ncbi:hypothetical protein [Brevibacillus agri]|nr:hypothetical protein [Brevibacillus agri]MDR9507195.1 hypothetical protein [Brevibacillus agri]
MLSALGGAAACDDPACGIAFLPVQALGWLARVFVKAVAIFFAVCS